MNSETNRASQSKGRLIGWILFIATLLVLSFGATPYHKMADTLLITIRLSLVLVLSILVIQERWKHRHDLPGGRNRPNDAGESVLQRARRWYYDEHIEKQ